jgi:hypothetical protein
MNRNPLSSPTSPLDSHEVQSYAEKGRTHYVESTLRGLIRLIADATANDKKRRLIAMSWFSQLLVDLESWNREFIEFLLGFPGYAGECSLADRERFDQEVSRRVTELNSYSIRGDVRSPICQRLGHLERRLDKDFKFLAEESPDTYEAVRTLIGRGIRFPSQFISLAIALSWDIHKLNCPMGGYRITADDPMPSVDDVKARIDEYIQKSAETLEKLDSVLNEAGLELLTVEEFNDICASRGSEGKDSEQRIMDRTVSTAAPDFDIAISYASEDVSYARELAVAARARGLRAFFDHFDSANLWGAHLGDYLGSVFNARALFTVVLASNKYAKAWTSFELQEARTRAIVTKQRTILPVLLEDCDVPGLGFGIGHRRWTEDSPRDLLDLLVEKVRSLR